MEDFTTVNPASGSFEPLTLTDFDRRYRSARSWMTTMQIVTVVFFLSSLVGLACIATKFSQSGRTGLLVALLITIFVIFIVALIVTGFSINRRFSLCCPCCNRALYWDFDSFRDYIRCETRYVSDFNPFISGQCRKCKKIVIETDQQLSSFLKERNKRKRAHSSQWISLACFFIGIVAFLLIVNSRIQTLNSDEHEPLNMDIYSAWSQIGEGDFLQAKKTLTHILAKQPNYSTAHWIYGYISLQQDDLESALHHYQKALPYTDEPDRIKKAISLINKKLKDKK